MNKIFLTILIWILFSGKTYTLWFDPPDTLKNAPVDSNKIKQKKLTPLKFNFYQSVTAATISKSEIERDDYRYAGDLIPQLDFGFKRDLGFTGQPSEILIYGFGFNTSSYLQDGIIITNRLNNAFDLNLFQADDISSLTAVPLTRGFLYNEMNNPLTLRIATNGFKEKFPYTRIHFYQAPNGEGFFDGIFNSNFGKRLSAYAQLTNQSIDPYYKKSEYGVWLANLKFRYLLTNDINIHAGYYYSKANRDLNGGVDADRILATVTPAGFDDLLYDNFLAPVNQFNRYIKSTAHRFYLRTVASLIGRNYSEIDFYYQTNLDEFRQNEFDPVGSPSRVVNDNKFNSVGVRFNHFANYSHFNFEFIATLDRTNFNSPFLLGEAGRTSFFLAGIARLNLGDTLFIPSLFAKYLNVGEKSFNGFGGDLSINLGSYRFYVGYSKFEKPFSILDRQFFIRNESDSEDYSLLELKAAAHTDKLKLSFGYFWSNVKFKGEPVFTDRDNVSLYINKDKNLSGINFSFDFWIWKLLFSTNSAYYFSAADRREYNMPELTSNGGLYYIDTLFSGNLDLKAGFNYKFIGARPGYLIDFQIMRTSNYFIGQPILWESFGYRTYYNSEFSPSYQIDLFLSGRIQESATVHFVWENLLDAKYFVVPYYPMYRRGIRFGVAWEFLD